MFHFMKSPAQLLALMAAALVAAWCAPADWTSASAPSTTCLANPAEPATQQAGKGGDDRAADRAAVAGVVESLTKAFSKGDAKAVAAHWTSEGEYISDDGVQFQGRPAIENAYGEFFAKAPDNMLETEVESTRFPSRDVAVVEGHFKLRKGKEQELVVSRCSFLFSRENGKWLIAIARESPGDGLELRDMEWLIGEWESKQEGTIVTTKYEWTKNKTFIRCHISITQEEETITGTQMIGKMPSTGGLHIWTFGDEGGIGDADVTRDGKKWYISARGSTGDGQVITATNIMTQIDANSFLWQSVERTADNEALPDLPPIKVVRVKANP